MSERRTGAWAREAGLPRFSRGELKLIFRGFDSGKTQKPSKWVNLFTRLGQVKMPYPYIRK